MLRRMISNLTTRPSDDPVTKAVIEELHRTFDFSDDSTNPMTVVAKVKDLADDDSLEATPEQLQAMRNYLESLPEPQRTIAKKHLDGVDKHEIARSTGLGLKPVCKSLARTFSHLRIILSTAR